MTTEADIQAALKTIIHPTYGMSLIALQMVRAIRLFPERIEVDLVMNCAGCPAGEAALAQARRAIEALLPADGGRVIIQLLPEVWRSPWEGLAQEFW
ncbi:MAG: iron-sulfur cluster assembly protein [Chloroflexota bacterium]